MRRNAIGLLAAVGISALGAAIAVVIVGGASASPGSPAGSSVSLTATNGTNTIAWQDATRSLSLNTTVTGGAWSGDGSRMAFVSGNGAIETVRFNNASDIDSYAPADGTPRSHPTWYWNENLEGGFPLWSAHVTDPNTHMASDVIQFARSDGAPVQTVGLPSGTNWTSPDTGIDQVVVQGQVGSGAPGVYAFDNVDLFDQSVTPTLVVADASSPSESPTNEAVAYVRDDADGHAQVWVTNLPSVGFSHTQQITSDPVDHSNPTWSPDNATIAFDEGAAVFTAKVDGSQAAAPVAVPGLSGAPAYEVGGAALALREAGNNRYETAVAISRAVWQPVGGAEDDGPVVNAVVLTRGDTFADALGGSALAAAKHGPLLLTPPTTLNPDTATEITRLLGKGNPNIVYLLGGTGAISTTVENQIKALGVKTQRIPGTDRYATATAIAQQIAPSPTLVFAATGINFPDALSAGAAAGSFDSVGNPAAVVVLTADASMPAATKKYLDGLNASGHPPTFVGVGGSAVDALANAGYTNGFGLVGRDRYDTAVRVAETFFENSTSFGVATGQNWPDALAGGAMLGTVDAPLLLTPPTAKNAFVTNYLSRNSASFGKEVVFGQSDVVSDGVESAYVTLIAGPDGGHVVAASPARVATGNLTAPGRSNLRESWSSLKPGHAPTGLPRYAVPLS